MSQVKLKLLVIILLKNKFLRNYLLFAFICRMFVVGCESLICLILNKRVLNQQRQANKLIIKILY
jgi:hypothetical protein